ncbi:MAG: 2-amino-4-hydroxy-6-hydroxymethyldihydropteridine diphosphokinase [Gemmataceae bacterium]
MPVAYIALGSNLGDRAATLHAALRLLEHSPGIRVTRISTFHETAPVGGPPGQGQYLNAAAELQTDFDPQALLAKLLEIEQQLGRVRSVKDAPRTLDLDLLLYNDLVREDADLIVPHPRMHERGFVLAPLAEIAAEVVHPQFGLTIRQMLERLQAS